MPSAMCEVEGRSVLFLVSGFGDRIWDIEDRMRRKGFFIFCRAMGPIADACRVRESPARGKQSRLPYTLRGLTFLRTRN